MKNRTECILVCSGEIFVLKFWLYNYFKNFRNEVDKFHLVLNWGGYWKLNPYLIDYVRRLVPEAELVEVEQSLSPGHGDDQISEFGMTPEQRIARKNVYEVPDSKEVIWLSSTDMWMRQGGAMNMVLPFVDTKYLVLMDADCFIFAPGQVDKYTKRMEEEGFHIVGTTGLWVSPDLIIALRQHNNKWYGRVNPFFSVFDTEMLFSIPEINLDCKNMYGGDYFYPLDCVIPGDKKYEGDQFTWACGCMQRHNAKTLHIGDNKEIPEFDIMDTPIHTYGKNCPIMHCGNLGGHEYYSASGMRPDGAIARELLGHICKVWDDRQNWRTYSWQKAMKEWSWYKDQKDNVNLSPEMIKFYEDYEINLQILREVSGITDKQISDYVKGQYEHREYTKELFQYLL